MGYVKRKNVGGLLSKGLKYAKTAYGAYQTAGRVRKFVGSAIRTKRPHKTKTRTYKKGRSMGGLIRTPPTGLSFSKTVLKYKQQRLGKQIKQANSPQTLETITAGTAIVSNGRQGTFVTCIGLSTSAPTSQTALIKLAHTHVEQDTSPGVISVVTEGATVSSAKQYSFKTMFQDVISETELTNASAAYATLQIYDCVSRITKVDYTAPDSDWVVGLTEQYGNGMGGTYPASSHQFPGSVPTESKLFNMNWKIVKKSLIELGTGRGHLHRFHFHPNRIVDTEYAMHYAQIKGITTCTMFVYRGAVVDDTASTGAPVVGLVSTADIKIVYTEHMKYRMRGLDVFPRATYQKNNLSFSISDKVMNEEGDAEDGEFA